MSDTPYSNGHFQIDQMQDRLRQCEETLSKGIYDYHARQSTEKLVERLRADIAKLTAWQAKQEKITAADGLMPTYEGGGNG